MEQIATRLQVTPGPCRNGCGRDNCRRGKLAASGESHSVSSAHSCSGTRRLRRPDFVMVNAAIAREDAGARLRRRTVEGFASATLLARR